MAANRPHGHAYADPTAPRAAGICDRCGFRYFLRDLRWQYQWAGAQLINLQLRVCDKCLDEPSAFLKTIVLPPDPPPLFNIRPEYAASLETDLFVDETTGVPFADEVTETPLMRESDGSPQSPPYEDNP